MRPRPAPPLCRCASSFPPADVAVARSRRCGRRLDWRLQPVRFDQPYPIRVFPPVLRANSRHVSAQTFQRDGKLLVLPAQVLYLSVVGLRFHTRPSAILSTASSFPGVSRPTIPSRGTVAIKPAPAPHVSRYAFPRIIPQPRRLHRSCRPSPNVVTS